MTDAVAVLPDAPPACSLSTMTPNEGSGEIEMANRECEPLGLPEMAAFLGVAKKTVWQWEYRGHLPEPDWIVNGMKAWNISTVEFFAFQDRGYSLEQLEECKRLWPERRGSTVKKNRNPWAGDPEKMSAAIKNRQAGAASAKKAAGATKAAKATKARKSTG